MDILDPSLSQLWLQVDTGPSLPCLSGLHLNYLLLIEEDYTALPGAVRRPGPHLSCLTGALPCSIKYNNFSFFVLFSPQLFTLSPAGNLIEAQTQSLSDPESIFCLQPEE